MACAVRRAVRRALHAWRRRCDLRPGWPPLLERGAGNGVVAARAHFSRRQRTARGSRRRRQPHRPATPRPQQQPWRQPAAGSVRRRSLQAPPCDPRGLPIGADPSLNEISIHCAVPRVPQALFDLEATNAELKGDLRDLWIAGATEVDVSAARKAILIKARRALPG